MDAGNWKAHRDVSRSFCLFVCLFSLQALPLAPVKSQHSVDFTKTDVELFKVSVNGVSSTWGMGEYISVQALDFDTCDFWADVHLL